VFGWTTDEKTAFDLLDAFVTAGLSCIDTADVYSIWAPGHSGGESETIIGSWLASRRNRHQVVIATKVGSPMGGDRRGLSKGYVAQAVEASLKRLQTDYIDLYQSHIDDTATPLEDTLDAYARLIAQGKVRAIGASNFTADRLASALDAAARAGVPRYESLQPQYNLADRDKFEGSLQEFCVKQEVGVICYYGLASGFLTGKYRSEDDLAQSPRGRGVKRYLDERGNRILGALDAVSAEAAATPAQVALAWLMAQPGVTAPIASATSTVQLEEIMGAAELRLAVNQIERLNSASTAESVAA
jgi:aryl-alcohol dehydrogenase-like predicted oxidoreductase